MLTPKSVDAQVLDPAPIAAVAQKNRSTLETGSILARTLYSVWSGEYVTIVDSPPGAGKSTLVAQIVREIRDRVGLSIVVTTPTNQAGAALASRIAEQLGLDDEGRIQVKVGSKNMPVMAGVADYNGRTVDNWVGAQPIIVRTVASCKMSAPECDIMIMDEAYQTTFADAAVAADRAQQVLMVGDPGQIGPVVTVNTSLWQDQTVAPDDRAPDGFAASRPINRLTMTTTYRLGSRTVDIIAPIYDFRFASQRPLMRISDSRGGILPEVDSFRLDTSAGRTMIDHMKDVAAIARGGIGAELSVTGAVNTALREDDICIVVPHNHQLAALRAILGAVPGGDKITIGTADSLQGGQWHFVVAVDPFLGHDHLSPHQLNLGRLCVMASRHLSHLTWVYSPDWEDALEDDEIPAKDRKTHRQVRLALTAESRN